ncbi:MAG: ABC transporter permease [Ruminiclostridium sp.]|nr:ABC transporter permease [Ruminiclostridium sp.]
MKISDMILISLRNLWRRKGRTLLTVIGVVIGSCAVIVMISLGLGMNKAMDTMLASWGDLNAVTIYNSQGGGGMYYIDDSGMSSSSGGSTEKPPLNEAALEELSSLEHVKYAVPKMEVTNEMVSIAAGRNDRYRLSWAQITGIDFSQLDKYGYEVDKGTVPNEKEFGNSIMMGLEIPYQFIDTKKHGNAAMTYRQQLPDGSFTEPFIDPLEDLIKFSINNTKKMNEDGTYQSGGKGYEFKMNCTGIFKEDTMWETPYSVFVDINTAKSLIESYNRLNGVKKAKEPQYSQIKLICDDINSVDAVQKKIEELGYSASSMAQIRNQMQGELGVIQMILGGLAAISLLVAAISITNTMIMSIYERTKEIGIMKVLGCYIGNIRLTFLMEAGLIGLLGGIIGTLISFVISIIMNSFSGSAFTEMFGIYTDGGQSEVSIIPVWLVLLALAFSTVIGLISGFYPANRAVKISALEAIRNE